MADASGSKRAKRLALIIIGALLLIAVPYGYAIFTKYRYFVDYVAETLDDPKNPPGWTERAFDPMECVDYAVVWAAGCNAEAVFCDGGFRRVIRECMGSRDRGPWCAEKAEDWASTRFGYHDCEARVAAAKDPARAEAEDDYCPDAFRALAAHCKAKGLRPGGP